jgi:outer membrane protein W
MSLRPFVMAAAVALLALPLTAQSSDIGIWALASRVTGSTRTDPSTRFEFKEKIGYGASFNHFWGTHLSTDFAFGATKNDARLTIGGVQALALGSLKQSVVTGTLQWHFARGGAIDPYLGVGAAYVKTDDFRSNDLNLADIGTVKIDNKTAALANAGINLRLMRGMALALDAKYIPLEPNASGLTGSAVQLRLSPVIYGLGLRFRF